MMDSTTTTYQGATESELHHLSSGEKLSGLLDQRRLFPHHGTLTLETDRLILGSWREIPRALIAGVDLEFTEAYTRFMAGGVRGQFPSAGVLGNAGKPLIIRLQGERSPLYVLIEFHWVMGTTRDEDWWGRLNRWLTPPV